MWNEQKRDEGKVCSTERIKNLLMSEMWLESGLKKKKRYEVFMSASKVFNFIFRIKQRSEKILTASELINKLNTLHWKYLIN